MSKGTSGQVDPKKTNGEKRVKRGRLHFTEEEVTRQDKEQASGQVGPKSQSTGKFRQDGEREKPSSRLRQEGEAREDTVCEEQAARKDQKDKREKKKERAEAKAEHSAVRLELAKEKLSRQEPPKPPSLPKQAVMVAGAGVWAYGHRKIHEVEHENVGVEGAHKTELLAEAGAHKVSRYAKRRIREHPARQVRKWERRTIKANADLHYQKMVQEHPELNSTFLSRMAQKWKIKREYAKQAREAARQTAKAAGAAATIRIHADGVDSASASGASVLVPGSSNPYIPELAGSSSQLGSCIINSYCAATGMKNRGVVGSDNMTGINWSTNPVALLELGFMTNPTDDANMQDDTYQQLMVRGIADGIDAYFGR